MVNCFQDLLSNSTCAATPRRSVVSGLGEPPKSNGATWPTQSKTMEPRRGPRQSVVGREPRMSILSGWVGRCMLAPGQGWLIPFPGSGIHPNPPKSDPRPNPSESGIHFCRVKMPMQNRKFPPCGLLGIHPNPPESDSRPNPSESGTPTQPQADHGLAAPGFSA